MPQNFYKDCLTEDLQESVAAQLKLLTSEQLSLNEEVAVHRERCKDSIGNWSKARSIVKSAEVKLKESPNNQVMQDLLTAANAHLNIVGERMADTMKSQKDFVMSAVVADSKTRETLTQNTLMLLMNAVVSLVHEYFNEGDQQSVTIMDKFENELRSRVVFQEADDQALAVEYEFGAMIETVPQAPGVASSTEISGAVEAG